MKKLILNLLTVALVSISLLALAQDELANKKNNWRSEFGVAFTGSGDGFGYVINLEYARQVNERIFIAPAFSIMNFSSVYSAMSTHGNAQSLEITGYYRSAGEGVVNVEIGLGTFVRHWRWDYATGPNISFGTDKIYLEPSSNATSKYFTLGYTIAVGAVFRLGEAVSLSTRLALQNDTEGDIVTSLRPGLIIKF